MDNATVLYSIDDAEWLVYSQPVLLPQQAKVIKAKVIYLGKESNTTWLWLSNSHATADVQEQNTGATF